MRYLILFCALLMMASPGWAADLDLQGCPVTATPFDGIRALNWALSVRPEAPLSAGGLDLEGLFFRARRIAYIKDGNRRNGAWQFPEETEIKNAGDCEDKALWLFSRMREAGFENVRLVIGKYRMFEPDYHVWILTQDARGRKLLVDPTIQKKIWDVRMFSKGFYIPYYSFEGPVRFRHQGAGQELRDVCEDLSV